MIGVDFVCVANFFVTADFGLHVELCVHVEPYMRINLLSTSISVCVSNVVCEERCKASTAAWEGSVCTGHIKDAKAELMDGLG